MISFDASQLAILASSAKTCSWLFHIQDRYLTDYYYSTKLVVFDGQTHNFKVTDFSGVTLVRPKTETGVMSPSSLNFTLSNKDSALNPDDLEDGTVTLTLAMSPADASAEIEMLKWKFIIRKIGRAHV